MDNYFSEIASNLFKYSTPCLSKNPGRSYVNVNDLDLRIGNLAVGITRCLDCNLNRLVQQSEGGDRTPDVIRFNSRIKTLNL